MIYQLELFIDRNVKDVSRLFTDVGQMKKWEDNLDHIEPKKGNLFENGSEANLFYAYGSELMKMNVYVESNQLPHEITLIYQVPGVWNRCVNTFIELEEKTRWIMHVEFRFEHQEEPDIETFKKATYDGMMKFKAYAEVEDEKA